MRRCRKADAAGGPTAESSPPEAIKPFLDVLAETLAEAVLRELRSGAARPTDSEVHDGDSHPARLQSSTEDLAK